MIFLRVKLVIGKQTNPSDIAEPISDMDVRETFREHFNPTASLPELNSTIQIFQHIQKWKLVPIIVDR